MVLQYYVPKRGSADVGDQMREGNQSSDWSQRLSRRQDAIDQKSQKTDEHNVSKFASKNIFDTNPFELARRLALGDFP